MKRYLTIVIATASLLLQNAEAYEVVGGSLKSYTLPDDLYGEGAAGKYYTVSENKRYVLVNTYTDENKHQAKRIDLETNTTTLFPIPSSSEYLRLIKITNNGTKAAYKRVPGPYYGHQYYTYDSIADIEQMISLGPNDTTPDKQCYDGVVNNDMNRFLVFSFADNWFGTKSNGHVYYRNLETNTTHDIARNTAGTEPEFDTYPIGDSYHGYYSGYFKGYVERENGTYVTYESGASDIVSDDTNDKNDVFLFNISTGETKRISLNPDRTQRSSNTTLLGIVDNERVIMYTSGELYEYNIGSDTVKVLYSKSLSTILGVSKDGNRIFYRLYDGTARWKVLDVTSGLSIDVFRDSSYNSTLESEPILSVDGRTLFYRPTGKLFVHEIDDFEFIRQNAVDQTLPATIEQNLAQGSPLLVHFTLTQQSKITLSSAGSSADVDGTLYDGNGTKLSSVRDSDAGADDQLFIEKILPAGEYYLKAFLPYAVLANIKLDIDAQTYDTTQPWLVDLPRKVHVLYGNVLNFSITVKENSSSALFRNLQVSSDNLPEGIKLEKGSSQWRLVGTAKQDGSAEVSLLITDPVTSFSQNRTLTIEVDHYYADGFTDPVIIVSDEQTVTQSLKTGFTLHTPEGESNSVTPSCYIQKEDGTRLPLYIEKVPYVSDRWICYQNRSDDYLFASKIGTEDFISFAFTLSDDTVVYQKSAVQVDAYLYNDSNAYAVLESLSVDEGFNASPEYLVVNQTVFSGSTIPKRVYLGGKQGQWDFVYIRGGAWKLIAQGHETIVSLNDSIGTPKALAFTVSEENNFTAEQDIVHYIAQPESEFDLLVRKTAQTLINGNFIRVMSNRQPRWLIRECDYTSPLSQAEAAQLSQHPCISASDEYISTNQDYVAGVRGTTFKIRRKGNLTTTEVYEGIVDELYTDGNLTIETNQYSTSSGTVAALKSPALDPEEERYLKEHAIIDDDSNISTGTVTIATGEAELRYTLIGKTIQSGEGTLTQFSNVQEGNYTVHFFPLQGFYTPKEVQVEMSSISRSVELNISCMPINMMPVIYLLQ
jgi:hypothetical protein